MPTLLKTQFWEPKIALKFAVPKESFEASFKKYFIFSAKLHNSHSLLAYKMNPHYKK